MNDRSRRDLLSSAMTSMLLAGQAGTPSEAAQHRADYRRYLAEADAAHWEKPRVSLVC